MEEVKEFMRMLGFDKLSDSMLKRVELKAFGPSGFHAVDSIDTTTEGGADAVSKTSSGSHLAH